MNEVHAPENRMCSCKYNTLSALERKYLSVTEYIEYSFVHGVYNSNRYCALSFAQFRSIPWKYLKNQIGVVTCDKRNLNI